MAAMSMFLHCGGHPSSPALAQLRLRLTQFGMLVVLAIMVVAIGNDVLRLLR